MKNVKLPSQILQKIFLFLLTVIMSTSAAAAMACVDLGMPTSVELKKMNPWIKKRIKGLHKEIRTLESLYPGRVFVQKYGETHGHDLLRINIRATRLGAVKVLVTAGLHGNESLGPITAMELVKNVMNHPKLSDSVDLTIYPMTNPHALLADKRRVRKDVDLNRVFTSKSAEPEIMNLIKDMLGQKFDLALDLHGGPTKKDFFVIRAGEDNGLATNVLSRFPISLLLSSNTGTYPGHAGIPSDPLRYQMNSVGVATSNLPGTLKSFMANTMKVPFAYTIEYPGRMNPKEALAMNRGIVRRFILTLLALQGE